MKVDSAKISVFIVLCNTYYYKLRNINKKIESNLFFENKIHSQYQEHKAYGVVPAKGFGFEE